jgi:hypothetical protein
MPQFRASPAQHRKAQIEHEAQAPQSGHQLARELEALAGKISELG